jgi:hypothetical protein
MTGYVGLVSASQVVAAYFGVGCIAVRNEKEGERGQVRVMVMGEGNEWSSGGRRDWGSGEDRRKKAPQQRGGGTGETLIFVASGLGWCACN